jgi:hypothetical protein
MKPRDACLAIGGALSLLLLVAPSPIRAQGPSLASGEQVAQTAIVRDVKVRDSTVSGVIVNKSPRVLRDVKLMIRHAWLWKNERHPGDDNPGRAEYYTVPGEVAAGGSLPFTYHLEQPLPERTDGHFVTSADVISFTEVGK